MTAYSEGVEPRYDTNRSTWSARYYAFFRIGEIEASAVLQWAFWALLFGYFLSFQDWIYKPHISEHLAASGRHLCPPYFKECGDLYLLTSRPHGYSQTIFYSFLGLGLCAAGYFAVRKQWLWAHMCMIPLFLWKILMVFILTHAVSADFEYFHMPAAFVFLFCGHKLYFMRRIFVLVYFSAAVVKFHASWVVGSYFTSLALGIPLFPDALTPIVTNFVIALEILGPWLLLSETRRTRVLVLIAWILFHQYSIILVGFRYPGHCLPLLLVLFVPDVKNAVIPLGRWSWVGWASLAWICLLHAVPFLIEGDTKYTMEGHKYGVSMFDSNQQCVSKETLHFVDGRVDERQYRSRAAMRRCVPYRRWFRIHMLCQNSDVSRVEWQYLKSINMGPFYKLVDSSNACELDYQPLVHNEWIRTPETGAEVVGYPRKNFTNGRDPFAGRPYIHDEPIHSTVASQEFFMRHASTIVVVWKVLWWGMLVAVVFFALRRKVLWMRENNTH